MTDPGKRINISEEPPAFTQDDFKFDGYEYPDWKPFEEGHLDVGDGHQIYYQVAGNPNGIPVVALHGGPGEGAKAAYGEHFDPNLHKIIIYDQRGAGLSTPYAETAHNSIEHLVSDLHALKEHVGAEEKWGVYGISWGTTLAMHYATEHPEDVSTLVLDATCFGDQPSAEWLVDPSQDWLNEGTAEQQSMKKGAYDEYVNFIRDAKFLDDNDAERQALNDLPLSQAYYECLSGKYGHEVAVDAATQFMIFDMKLLSPELTDDSPAIQGARSAAEDNLALSRLFYHFYINEYNADGPEALIDKMADRWSGQTVMIHGTEDIITPLNIAEKLKDKLDDAHASPILYTYQGYGHFKMDHGARIATRQILFEEMREQTNYKTYEQAIQDRITALEDRGLHVDIDHAHAQNLTTDENNLRSTWQEFVTAHKTVRKPRQTFETVHAQNNFPQYDQN